MPCDSFVGSPQSGACLAPSRPSIGPHLMSAAGQTVWPEIFAGFDAVSAGLASLGLESWPPLPKTLDIRLLSRGFSSCVDVARRSGTRRRTEPRARKGIVRWILIAVFLDWRRCGPSERRIADPPWGEDTGADRRR